MNQQEIKDLVKEAPRPERVKSVKYTHVTGRRCKIEYGRSGDDAMIHIFAKHGKAVYSKSDTRELISRISKFVPRSIKVNIMPPKGVLAPMYTVVIKDFYSMPANVDRQVMKIVEDLKENL